MRSNLCEDSIGSNCTMSAATANKRKPSNIQQSHDKQQQHEQPESPPINPMVDDQPNNLPSLEAIQNTKNNNDNSTSNQANITAADIVFPGDKFNLVGSVVRLGPGIVVTNDSIIASRFGRLIKHNVPASTKIEEIKSNTSATTTSSSNSTSTSKLWISSNQKRYIPAIGDQVIGIIMEKNAENYRVEIGAAELAVLPVLAFQGATKRNKPNLPIGGLTYCLVENSHKFYETQLTCISPHFSKEWVTGLSIFGELSGGYKLDCSLKLCQALLEENNIVLALLGKYIPFELAIGGNGRIWLSTANNVHLILIINAIQNSEHLSEKQTILMVHKLIQSINEK
jgi:exosome complex component RRP40